MESVHAMVRGRAVGKGPVQAGTSLAAYPTARDAAKAFRAWPCKTRLCVRRLKAGSCPHLMIGGEGQSMRGYRPRGLMA